MKEVICEHCRKWTDGELTHCLHCKGLLNAQYLKEREELAKQKTGLPLIEIDPEAPWPTRLGKHIARLGQLIFFAILSIIAAMASSTVH